MKLVPLLLAACGLAAASYYQDEWTIDDSRSDEWLDSKISSEKRRIVDNSFVTGREYKFFYNGQLTSGISGSSSQLHSGTRIQSLVSLVFKSSDKVLLKMTNTRFGKLNEQIPEPRALQPFDAFELIDIEQTMVEKLELPIQFTFTNGMISDIKFDGAEQPWSANIKRAVLNMIQVNLSKENRFNLEDIISSSIKLDINDERIDVNNEIITSFKSKSFTVVEKSIEGECETLYTVVPSRNIPSSISTSELTGQFYTVTKSINFDRCERRPEVRYNERLQQPCNSCNEEQENKHYKQERNLMSTSVIRMQVVCADRQSQCLVVRANVNSQYDFVVFDAETKTMSSFVRQSLKLISTGTHETEISAPRNVIESEFGLLYGLEWDILKEQFFLDGEHDFQDKTPFSKLQHKVNFVKSLLQKLIEYTREQVQEEAPRQISRLVRVMRMLKANEINQIYESFIVTAPEGFTREDHIKIKDFLLDSMALCGTTDCIDQLVHVIKRDQVSSIKASMLIRKLMDTRVVNERMITKVMHICEKGSQLCERSQQIKQAVYLTVGSMMRTLCLSSKQSFNKPAIASKFNSRVNFMDEFCPTELREKFVQKLIARFESTESQTERVLMLKSLSNSGLKEMLPFVYKVIKNKSLSPILRVEAILASRLLAETQPRIVIKQLLPIFMSRAEQPSVRIAAVYQLMQCQPDKLAIDQITRQLNTERHPQVQSFTFSLLNTLSRSRQPCMDKISRDIQLSLRQVRSLRRRELGSWQWRVMEKMNGKRSLGASIDLFNVDSTSSFVPHKMAASLHLNWFERWSPKFVSVQWTQSGVARVLNQLWRSQSHMLQSSLSDIVLGNFEMPSPRFNYRSELKEVFKQLNLEPESMTSEFEQFGAFNLMFKNQEYAFMPLAKEIISEELYNKYTSGDMSVSKLMKMITRNVGDKVLPFSFHSATFLHEQSRKIPTSLGLPVTVSVKVPTVMQATGSLKLDVNSGSSFEKASIMVKDFKPSLASTVVVKMECWSPIVNSGVKVTAAAKVFAPFEAAIRLDTTKQPIQMQLVVSPIVQQTKQVFVMHTTPTTFSLVWPKFLTQWKQPEERTIYSQDFTRALKIDETYGEHSVGIKWHARGRWQRSQNSAAALLSGPNKYIITMSPGHEMPKEFVFTITGKLFNSMEKTALRTNFNGFFKDSSENFLSHESSEEQEFEKEQYEKIYTGSEAISNEIEIRLTTKGSPVKREAILKKSLTCDRTSKTCQIRLSIERTPIPNKENKPWKLVSEIDTVYPKTPLNLNELSSEKRLISRITTKWGSEEQKKFNMKVMAEQSSQLRSLMESSVYRRLFSNEQHRSNFRSLFSPVGQFKQTLKYGLMDEIKIDVDYKLTPYEEEYLQSVYAYLKHVYYKQTETRMSTAERLTSTGRLNIKINIDPITRRYMNASITTPFDRTHITDVPVWQVVPNALNLRRVSSPSRSLYETVSRWFSPVSSSPMCEARTNLITMFNKRQMEVPTSTCYSVLAKDCQRAESSKFAVLIKKQSANHERKTLKIVTEPIKLVISVNANEQLECRVNDEQKPCGELKTHTIHNGHQAVSCRLDSESVIECQLIEAGISVFFDGYAADIKVSPLYSSSVCGLCGVISSSWEKQIDSEPRSLLEKYLLPSEQSGEQCQHEFNERTRPISSWSNSVFDDEDEFNSYSSRQMLPEYLDMPLRERSSVVRPVRRTRVIEQDGQLCFSVKPVRVCPRNTHPNRREQAKHSSVVFSCLSRNSVQADELLRELSERDVLSLSEQTPSFTETISEPISCKHYF